MRRILLLSCAPLVFVVSLAHAAAGVNIRWTSCFGDGGTFNRNFACDTNTGFNVLVSSFELGQPILQVVGNEAVLDFASPAPSLPSWWLFKNAGTCRQNALSANFVAPATPGACADWTSGQAGGGIGSYNVGTFSGPTTARMTIALAVPISVNVGLVAGQEYFSNNLVIRNDKTVGTDACAGCATPVCIVFTSLRVTTPVSQNDRTLTTATNGTDSNYATWQGGAGVTSFNGSGCPAATPARQPTWGSVKALYR